MRVRQSLAEEGLFASHQAIVIAQVKPFPQSDFIGNSHEVLLIRIPIELNPQGLQGLVPGPLVYMFRVGQDAVEIK